MSKILIVNDEPDLCEIVQTLLQTNDHEVQQTFTMTEAIELLSTEDYDLIILDLLLEGDGFELLKNMSNLPPILILTVVHNPKIVKFIDELGLKYMPKPFNNAELLKTVSEMLNKD